MGTLNLNNPSKYPPIEEIYFTDETFSQCPQTTKIFQLLHIKEWVFLHAKFSHLLSVETITVELMAVTE